MTLANKLSNIAVFCTLVLLRPSAALAADFDKVVVLNNEGMAALNKGNHDVAVRKLLEATDLDPQYTLAKENLAVAFNSRGMERYRLGRYESAYDDFDRSLRLENSKSTRANRCFASLRLKHFESAYEDAVRVSSPELKGLADIGLGQLEEAIHQLKNVEPANALSNLGLCIAYRGRGNMLESNRYKAKLKRGSKELSELTIWQKLLLSRISVSTSDKNSRVTK